MARVTPAPDRAHEARPGLSPSIRSLDESRRGAPRGERPPTGSLPRPRTFGWQHPGVWRGQWTVAPVGASPPSPPPTLPRLRGRVGGGGAKLVARLGCRRIARTDLLGEWRIANRVLLPIRHSPVGELNYRQAATLRKPCRHDEKNGGGGAATWMPSRPRDGRRSAKRRLRRSAGCTARRCRFGAAARADIAGGTGAASGDGAVCLPRTWPLMPPQLQQRAYDLVRQGGPRRARPATHSEWLLRGFPPTNFVL